MTFLKKTLLLVSMCLLFKPLLAQTSFPEQLESIDIEGIPLKTVHQMVSDERGVYYYPELLRKFREDTAYLAKIDIQMLYYGYAFQKSYNPYKTYTLEDSVVSLNLQKKWKETLQVADRLLEESPVSLFGNVEKAMALGSLGLEKEAYKYLERYKKLITIVEASGIGNSYENAIVLITPKDAEVFMARFKLIKLENTINGKNGKYYEVYLVRNQEEKQYPIYFDITIPYTLGMKKLKD